MSEQAPQSKQRTDKGLEIEKPKRRDFDSLVRKVAGGRKDPAEKDRPPERSD